MEKFNLVAGLPRAGSTLLCQLLNSSPDNHVTPTSGIIDIIKNIRSTFSHNPSFKAQQRLELTENIRMGMFGFLHGYFQKEKYVFDKCRAWTNQLNLLDAIVMNQDTKVIWCYRNPVEIVSSIEAHYQKTLMLENVDEQAAPQAFTTLDRRINTYISDGGLISYPVEILNDAIEMGYLDRILFVKYHDLTNDTQNVMDKIHDFVGIPRFTYDLNNVKQTTFEWDGVYNFKFPHVIKEGKIEFKQGDIRLTEKYVNLINQKYAWINNVIFGGELVNITSNPPKIVENPIEPQKTENSGENK